MYNSNFTELTTIVKPGNTTFIQANGIARVNLWDKTKTYPSGALVLHAGYLYSATQAVDSGIDIGNTKYWQCLTYPIVDLATRIQTLSDTKLDKITNAYQIYATDKNGEQCSHRFSSSGLPETIMFREYGSGTCDIADPIEPSNIANKRYVDTGLDGKLDKVTTAFRIYGTGKNGEQCSYKFSSTGIPETIMFREFGSGTCNIADPIEPLNIANKKYVDDGLSGKLDKVTTPFTIYGTDENGNQHRYKTGYGVESGKIQYMGYTPNGGYNNNGYIDSTITGTYTVGIPSRPGHATPKKWVEDLVNTGLKGKLDLIEPDSKQIDFVTIKKDDNGYYQYQAAGSFTPKTSYSDFTPALRGQNGQLRTQMVASPNDLDVVNIKYLNERLSNINTGGDTSSLPEVTEEDNGKFLRVVDGAWAATIIQEAETVEF